MVTILGRLSNLWMLQKLWSRCNEISTYTSNKIAIPKAPKAKYQITDSLKKENMYQMLKKYELSLKNFEFLKKYYKKRLDFVIWLRYRQRLVFKEA